MLDGRTTAKSIKVCFIAGTLGRGGAERQLLYMLRALQNSGIDARVLCLIQGEDYENLIREMGVDVEWVGASSSRIVRLSEIVRNVRKRPVDIIQSVHFYTNIYAGTAGRLLRVPNIGAIRSDLSFELAQNNFYGNWHLKLPKHLIANSEAARERAIKHGIKPGKIDLLCNAVELPIRTIREFSGDYVSILFAGRLSKEKRPDLFVELAVRLQREMPDLKLKFVVAGDGPLRTDLEGSVQAAGLSSVFSFLGQQEQMDKIYCRTDMLVLTSEHEGTPNVVLEAMSHGLPVVATDVGGVREILGSDRGFVVDAGGIEEMCRAVTNLIMDRDLCKALGYKGREYVATSHSLEYLGNRLMDIYSNSLGIALNGHGTTT